MRTIIMTVLMTLPTLLMASAIDVHDFSSEENLQLYQKLSEELRCPKCQNQNLSGSNSQIAIDMRTEVARLVEEGMTEAEVKGFMVDRYGDFVLYRPPVQSNTMVLWVGPAVIFGIGIVIFAIILVRRSQAAADIVEAPESDTDTDTKTEE